MNPFARIMLVTLACSTSGVAQEAVSRMRLSSDEYSILHNALERGATRYGGIVTYTLALHAAPSGAPQWEVVVDDSTARRVISAAMSDQTREVVDSVEFASLTPAAQHVLQVVQAVNRKLQWAIDQPEHSITTLSGRVLRSDENSSGASNTVQRVTALDLDLWHPDLATWHPMIVGPVGESLREERWTNRRVVLNGYILSPTEYHATKAIELRSSTVEIFTMSQCPFGQNAIKGMLGYLDAASARASLGDGEAEPCSLDIRYIFYPKRPATQATEAPALEAADAGWWCMHGEAELHENLVQMLVRDTFPERFRDYLHARLSSPGKPWRELVLAVGLDGDAADYIENAIAVSRDALIQTEYDYVAGLHGVTDGSPTWLWESRIVPDIRHIKRFKDINLSGGSCAGAHP